MASPSVVQLASAHGTGNGAPPGVLTLGAAPTAGNLIVAFISIQPGVTLPTVDATKWTTFQLTATTYMLGLYRYAQGGDTAALPAFCTAGNTYWAAMAYEIANVSGVFASDVLEHEAGTNGANSTAITNMGPTDAANALCLIGAACYNGTSGSLPSYSAGWTSDSQNSDFANYGVWGSAEQVFVSSGSTVSCTIAFPAAPNAYIAMRFSGQAPITFSLTGVSAAGSAAAPGPGVGAELSGASASGAAGTATTAHDGSVSLAGVSAAGAAAGLGFDHDVHAVGASAGGAPGSVGVGNTFALTGVATASAAAGLHPQTEPFAVFPVFSLMRDTPVPAIGAMSNDPVCAISPLPPDGPFPISTAVHLVGASAQGAFGTATPFRNVEISLVGVASQAVAALVVAA